MKDWALLRQRSFYPINNRNPINTVSVVSSMNMEGVLDFKISFQSESWGRRGGTGEKYKDLSLKKLLF